MRSTNDVVEKTNSCLLMEELLEPSFATLVDLYIGA